MTRLLVPSLLAMALAAPAAQALTPAELWSAWQARAAGFGATLGAEAVPGADGSLTLRSWTFAVPGQPPESLPADSPIQELVLRPTGDGAVAIDLGLPAGGLLPLFPELESGLRVEQEGLALTARDAEGGIDYELAVDRLRLVTMTTPDAPVDFAMELAGFALRVPDRPSAGGPTIVAASLSADGVAYVLNTVDPYAGVTTGTSRTEDISLGFSVTLPAGTTFETLDAGGDAAFLQALEDGLAMSFDVASGTSVQTGSASGDFINYEYSATARPSTARVTLDGTGFAVTARGEGATVSATSPILPFAALDADLGAFDMDVRAPFGPESGEYRYRVAVDSLTVGEEAWAAFDPKGLLPRGPARLVVDVGGRMTLDVATLSGAITAGPGAPPPEPSIESMEIREFAVAAAGAQATATGSLAFDAMMVPTGTGQATVTGANALIDALVAMGLVTDADAGNARLALGLYFDPGEGTDVLTTTLEARPDGTVLLNGQPVQ